MSKKIILSEDQVNKIVYLYTSGIKISEIETETGFSDSLIYRTLKENDIPLNRMNKYKNMPFDEIISLHNDGFNYKEIADKIGFSSSLIYKYLKENGLLNSYSKENCDMKISSFIVNSNKKYFFDEYIFDDINTPDKAYCLGLFMADGCNHLDSSCFSIELQARDVAILQKIKIMFQYDGPLSFTSASNTKNRTQDTYKLRLNSKYFCEKLNLLGIVPNKSLILDYPNWISKDLVPFLIKGYIDGDGWVQQYRIGFMSTDKFCYGVSEYLNSIGIECVVRDMKRNYNKHTKTLDITSRNNIIPLVGMMFSHGNLYLERKYERYVKYGFITNNL